MPWKIFKKAKLNEQIIPIKSTLIAANGKQLLTQDTLHIGKRKIYAHFFVINAPLRYALLDRDLIKEMWPNWKRFFQSKDMAINIIQYLWHSGSASCETENVLKEQILRDYADVFQNSMEERIKGYKEPIDKDVQPIFRKQYNIPYSLKDIVKEGLQRLQDQGIITPVDYAEWATAIVVVPKKLNNEIHIVCRF